jgi:hypothetical protein
MTLVDDVLRREHHNEGCWKTLGASPDTKGGPSLTRRILTTSNI